MDGARAEPIQLRLGNPFLGQLQEELGAVLNQEKFQHLDIASVVGVLEFLKWNLINRCD